MRRVGPRNVQLRGDISLRGREQKLRLALTLLLPRSEVRVPLPQSTSQAQPYRRDIFATMLLALAAVLAAWALFQSAKWSGRQTLALGQAAAARTHAARLAVQADQQVASHVSIFIAWAQAVAAEAPTEELRARGYRVKRGTLSGFLYARFPRELETAVEAWLATEPFRDSEAPPTPFDMPQYRLDERARANEAHDKAAQHSMNAVEFNARSDRYVATNVLIAMVLFFAGVATKLEGRWPTRIMLGLASVFLLAAAGMLATYPIALG